MTIALSSLRMEADLWYRVHVLLYDLSNLANDPSSRQRLDTTTNELYISGPYFTATEADQIRSSIVDSNSATTEALLKEDSCKISQNLDPNHHTAAEGDERGKILASVDEVTVEDAIRTKLTQFFGKRKASGDARPCGPHDLVPIYTTVFSICKEELSDESFMSRLHRSGLGDYLSKQKPGKEIYDSSDKKKRKNKGGKNIK